MHCQGSGDSDYSLQSSEISTATDDDPEALRRERELHQKEVEHRAMAQLEKARVSKIHLGLMCYLLSKKFT